MASNRSEVSYRLYKDHLSRRTMDSNSMLCEEANSLVHWLEAFSAQQSISDNIDVGCDIHQNTDLKHWWVECKGVQDARIRLQKANNQSGSYSRVWCYNRERFKPLPSSYTSWAAVGLSSSSSLCFWDAICNNCLKNLLFKRRQTHSFQVKRLHTDRNHPQLIYRLSLNGVNTRLYYIEDYTPK